MAKQRITLDLSEEAISSIRSHVLSGECASESEVIETALLSLGLPGYESIEGNDLPPWLLEEFKAAYEEDLSRPELALTSQQLDQHLATERALPAELAQAS